jgi:hypothetical protein
MASGLQVDAWGAFIPDRANLEQDLKQGVVSEVENRGLQDLTITTQELGVGTATQALVGEKREHLVFEQKLSGGTIASVALRIAPRGQQDLEISWRLMESNKIMGIFAGMSQGTLITVGIIWTLISIALMPLGVGFCTVIIGPFLIGMGMGWWGKDRGKTRATSYQQLDSRALAQAVDYSLMKTLENLGVSKDELRVLQAAQMNGIGKLGG